MSLEKITDKILAEAEQEVKNLVEDAEREAAQIISEAEEKAQAILKDAEDRGHEEREKIIEGRNSVINVDIRKITLEEKQKVLHEAFDAAGVDFEEHKRELQSEVAKILF